MGIKLGHIASIIHYLCKSEKSQKPLRATITYTSKCNQKCNMCSLWKRERSSEEELSLEEWIKIIDQLSEKGIKLLYLFGGEPFLRSDIYDFISYCKTQKKLFCEAVSNGTLFNPVNAEKLVRSGLDKLCISLDGPEEVHDLIRGIPGAFNRTLKGFHNVMQVKKKLGSNTPYLEIENTVQRCNFRVITNLLDIAKDIGVDEIRIRHMGVFLAEELKEADLILGSNLNEDQPIFSTGHDCLLRPGEIEKFREMLEEIKLKGKKYNIKLNIEPAFYNVKDFLIGREVKNCFHLWTHVFLDPWGRMHPCVWYDKFIIGDLRSERFDEVWNSRKYAVIRKNVSKLKACSKCCYFNITFKDNVKIALFKHQDMLKGVWRK